MREFMTMKKRLTSLILLIICLTLWSVSGCAEEDTIISTSHLSFSLPGTWDVSMSSEDEYTAYKDKDSYDHGFLVIKEVKTDEVNDQTEFFSLVEDQIKEAAVKGKTQHYYLSVLKTHGYMINYDWIIDNWQYHTKTLAVYMDNYGLIITYINPPQDTREMDESLLSIVNNSKAVNASGDASTTNTESLSSARFNLLDTLST